MGNSILKVYFNDRGEFTSVTIKNKYNFEVAAEKSVDYKPDMSKIRDGDDRFNKMRTTIRKHFNGKTIDNLCITKIKYVNKDDDSLIFECDLYKLYHESDYDDVIQYALEEVYYFHRNTIIDEKIYCNKYVEYFDNHRAWGVKLDNIDDMVESCTKEGIYKLGRVSAGFAVILYNDERTVGTVIQYTSGGKNLEGKWGGFLPNNYAINYGQESDMWSASDFFGETRKEVVQKMIDKDWDSRIKNGKLKNK